MEIEKREAVAGDLFLELEEIERLYTDKGGESEKTKSTIGMGPILTIACC